MVKNNVTNTEDIQVKVDQNNLIYIEPNSTVDADGNVNPRNIQAEKLIMYVNLEADIVPRSILVSDNEDTIERKFSQEDFIACGIFYRKEVLFDLGLYNEGFKFREGHELNERFLKSNLKSDSNILSKDTIFKYILFKYNF